MVQYYSPEELIRALQKLIYYYNHKRYHESINNLKPADVFIGNENIILTVRAQIKQHTISIRRNNYQRNKLILTN